jgi:hypothetical protein
MKKFNIGSILLGSLALSFTLSSMADISQLPSKPIHLSEMSEGEKAELREAYERVKQEYESARNAYIEAKAQLEVLRRDAQDLGSKMLWLEDKLKKAS